MWGLGKSFNELTSKTLQSVQKAGLRAKEIINQVDADDFFERELNEAAPPANPLKKPEVKPKDKESKPSKEGAKENLFNTDISAIEDNTNQSGFNISPEPSFSKAPSFKKQKPQGSPSHTTAQTQNDSMVSKSLDLNHTLSQPTQSNTDKNTKSNQDVGQVETRTPTSSSNSQAKRNKEAGDVNDDRVRELEETLRANEEALETYAVDNDKLLKEKAELKELADTFQSKNSELDRNLTEILAKNTGLEEQVNKLKSELARARQSTTVSDIHTEVSQDRKEAISDYIGECVGQYKTEISQKLVENLNQDLLDQIAAEEEGITEDVRNMLQSWVARADVLNTATEGVVPEEKIIKPFYDENMLREQIECHKDESNRLRTQAEEYEERLRQMEAQLKNEQAAFAKYKEETEQTLKKYTEDFVRVEQNLENLEEEAKEYRAVLKTRNEELAQLQEERASLTKYRDEADQSLKKYTEDFVRMEQNLENIEEEAREYKAVLQTRTEDVNRLEKLVENKDAEIKSLEEKLRAETEAKDDMNQQYEGIVHGMKDFEGTMLELNRENERLSAQHKEMATQLGAEQKRAREIEHSLSVETKNKLVEKLGNLNSLNRELEVEKVVESKLTVHDGRISADDLAQALEDALVVTLEMANKRYGNELGEEKEKERERYNALSANFDKVRGELGDALKREKEMQQDKEDMKRKNDELTEIVDNLNSSVGNYTNKIKELQKTIVELQETKKRYLDEAAAKNGEIEQLRMNVNALQEEREENANYLARLEAETGEIPELQARLERQAFEISNLSEIIQAKDEECAQLNGTIVNLQAVIDDNQQIQENMTSQYTNEIKRLRGDLEQSNRKSQILQEYKDKFEVLEKDTLEREAKIKELNMKLKETEQEKNAVNAEAAALIKKAKNDAMYKENLVDKRVITNFLIKYFDTNATFPVRLGILETLSSILGFSDDERYKLGLPRQVPEPVKPDSPVRMKSEKGLEESKTNQGENTSEAKEGGEGEKEGEKTEEQQAKAQPQKSFKQMFMSFLLENE